MGYLDMVEGSFQKRDDGREAFYPWGAYGTGYVLTAGSAGIARKLLKTFLAVSLGSMFATNYFLGLPTTCVACGIFLTLFAIAVSVTMSGVEKTTEKPNYHASSVNQAQAIGAAGN